MYLPNLNIITYQPSNFEYSIYLKFMHMINSDIPQYAKYGEQLSELSKYCTNFYKLNIKKLSKEASDENFSSCLGALKIIKDGWETEAIPETSDKNIEKIGFFAKFFKIH